MHKAHAQTRYEQEHPWKKNKCKFSAISSSHEDIKTRWVYLFNNSSCTKRNQIFGLNTKRFYRH